MASRDIVDTPEEAAAEEQEPLIVREPLERFLDENGLGSGDVTKTPWTSMASTARCVGSTGTVPGGRSPRRSAR